MAKANSKGAPAPKHPFIDPADDLKDTVLNIDSLLAVVEEYFEGEPDEIAKRATSAAYVCGQLLIIQAARQIARYAWEAGIESSSNVTKLEVGDE